MTDLVMKRNDETVSMDAVIADRAYPLKVTKGDEEKLQHAVQLVNENIKKFQRLYEGKDKQDYMAMCLLNLSVENVKLQTQIEQSGHLLEEKITELEIILDSSPK
jgi:cell division protein ZapA